MHGAPVTDAVKPVDVKTRRVRTNLAGGVQFRKSQPDNEGNCQ